MKQQIFSPVATVVSILFVGTTPVRAATIVFPDVVQASITRRGEFPRVHLSLLNFPSQGGGAVLTQVNSPTPAADKTTPRSLTIIGSVPSQSGQDNRVTIDLGEVTGTICDCGEIILPPVAGGGFPKWPLLALAAIPVLFIGSDEDVDAPLQPLQPPSVQSLVPPAPPPPQPIPEPTTLLLFGTGLLALSGDARRRARRRRRGGDRAKQSDKATSTRDVTS